MSDTINHEPCATRGFCYHAKGGRSIPQEDRVRGARTSGRLSVTTGHLASITTSESRKRGGFRLHELHPDMASKNGRRAVRTGQLLAASSLAGRKAVLTGRLRQIASLGGRASGPANGRLAVETGQLRRVASIGGKAGGPITAQKIRHQIGPNREELRLYSELDHLGISFRHDIPIGPGMGLPDIVTGRIIGELDGGGHHAFMDRTESDSRHDSLRTTAGFTVIRDSDPLRLARRIADAVRAADVLWP